MPVTATNLTSGGSNSAAASYNTASVSAPAGALVLVSVSSDVNAVVPTVSGLNSSTFTQVSTASGGTNNQRVTVFRSLNLTGKTGAITISFSSTSNLSTVGWVVDYFKNIDQSGTNGANAIVQSTTNTGSGISSLTVTLAAFSSANNATYGTFVINGSSNITAGSGFSELGETTNSRHSQTEWKNTNDTSVDASWGTSQAAAGIAVELKYSPIDLTLNKGAWFLVG